MSDAPPQQNISTPPIQEPPILSKHFHLPRVLMILFVVIITAIVFGSIGLLLGMTMQQHGNPLAQIGIQQTISTLSTNLTPNQDASLDLKRLTDLTSLDGAVNVYAQQHHGELPNNLQAPELSTYGYQFSYNDPQTNKPYGYHVITPDTFNLCTTFSNNSGADYSNTAFQNKAFAMQAPHIQYKKGYNCVPFTLDVTQADYKAAGESSNTDVSPSQ